MYRNFSAPRNSDSQQNSASQSKSKGGLILKFKSIPHIGIALLVITLATGAAYSNAVVNQTTMVRVAVLKDSNGFTLSVRGTYQIIDPITQAELTNGKKLRKSRVTGTPKGIKIATEEYALDHLRIIVKKDVSIYIKGGRHRYRGQMDIFRDSANRLLVVNTLDIENYVKGVLFHEVPHRWPLAAIKAQAVAARSYVLYQLENRVGQKYDVTSDIYSQAYGGRSAERHRTNIAANRTRGEVLSYRTKVLPAYFHSTCGGRTENVSELWTHDLLPLGGVKCGFCTDTPHYRWKKNFRSKDVQKQLNKHGHKLGLIKEITVLKRNASGRIKILKIITRDGKSKTISGTRFREIIGPNTLKSNHYDIVMNGYYFDVIGRGWGHGVGMCQWGAYQMSRQRYTYTSILKYYYPGAEIIKISSL